MVLWELAVVLLRQVERPVEHPEALLDFGPVSKEIPHFGPVSKEIPRDEGGSKMAGGSGATPAHHALRTGLAHCLCIFCLPLGRVRLGLDLRWVPRFPMAHPPAEYRD